MSAKDENIAAIRYGIAGMTNKAGLTFYEQHCDTLGGECGMLAYFVDCGEAFTEAEVAIGETEFDWYLAIDAFVVDLVECADLPGQKELLDMATRAISANVEPPQPVTGGLS